MGALLGLLPNEWCRDLAPQLKEGMSEGSVALASVSAIPIQGLLFRATQRMDLSGRYSQPGMEHNP